MRRYIPALLFSVAFAAPLLGCTDLINKLKGGGADAGDDAAVAVLTVDAAAAVPTAAVDPATDAAVLPTPTTTTTTLPTVAPTVVKLPDAGKPADAGVAVVDAGAKTDGGPAPAPTPTLKFPTNLFDGGGIRFDAGGFKPPWQK